MAVATEYIRFTSKGNADVVDITSMVAEKLRASTIREGIVTINACGSTGALTTLEYEPGLVRDVKTIFDQLIPRGDYAHNQTWHDDNGHSHLRASMVGPSIVIPFKDKKMILGTWQQIVFIDFDTRSRRREIVAQFMGE